MADKTGIEWTDATWNPVRGCSRVSEGCRNCYAESVAARFSGPGLAYEGLADRSRPGSKWTGEVRVVTSVIDQPIRWRRPRRIFVNSMADLFHANVTRHTLDMIFAVMAMAPQHTFQILTKRPERMRAYIDHLFTERGEEGFLETVDEMGGEPGVVQLPLPNVWLVVSAENQAAADERIPHLLATPAAKRFLSCEPLLGHLNIKWALSRHCLDIVSGFLSRGHFSPGLETLRPLDQVICGGESGAHARPMHPDWARSLRDQCAAAGVPFFFKQWGEYHPADQAKTREQIICAGDMAMPLRDGRAIDLGDQWTWRIGKKDAGSLLDGIEHKAFPA